MIKEEEKSSAEKIGNKLGSFIHTFIGGTNSERRKAAFSGEFPWMVINNTLFSCVSMKFHGLILHKM